MGLREYLGDDEGRRRRRRRLLLLLLLLLLVIVGAGFGGFVPGFGPSDDGPALDIDDTPTPTPPGSGPTTTAPQGVGTPETTATATPTGTPTGTGTQTDTDGPTDTATPTVTETDSPPGTPPTGTPPTPTATPTETPTDTPTPPPTTTTPPPTTTTPPPENGLDLSIDANDVILDYDGVAPGDSGSEAVTMSNDGSVAGNLSITAIEASDSENGIVGAEAEVDDTPNDGELSDHLRLAITATYPNGTSVALFGTGDGPRPVADLAAIEDRSAAGEIPPGEQATVRIDWLIPASTDNVIQSDGVDVAVTFELRAPEDGS